MDSLDILIQTCEVIRRNVEISLKALSVQTLLHNEHITEDILYNLSVLRKLSEEIANMPRS